MSRTHTNTVLIGLGCAPENQNSPLGRPITLLNWGSERGFTVQESMFAIVPVEVLADKRLTLWHIRVLIALLSFRAKNTDTVWPSREALADRCGGMHTSNVSKVTTELCELGWLVKEGSGGKSKSCRYKITVPEIETVAEFATVVKYATVAESTTKTPHTVAESTTQTVAESARGKEHTKEHTTKGNTQNARELIASFGVSDPVASDWILLRKQKKAAITQTALDGIKREADKAGYSMQDALRICCERGWSGFKAEWVADKSAAKPQRLSVMEQGMENAARAKQRMFGGEIEAS